VATTRRDILTVAGLAVLPIGGASAHDRSPGGDLVAHGRRLTELMTLPEAARKIAAVYLGGISETDWRQAAIDLEMPAVLAPSAEISETGTLRAWMGARIRADFDAGAIISVDGWRLSRTEVGACVLIAGVAEMSDQSRLIDPEQNEVVSGRGRQQVDRNRTFQRGRS
jgi:hypothetical protein